MSRSGWGFPIRRKTPILPCERLRLQRKELTMEQFRMIQ